MIKWTQWTSEKFDLGPYDSSWFCFIIFPLPKKGEIYLYTKIIYFYIKNKIYNKSKKENIRYKITQMRWWKEIKASGNFSKVISFYVEFSFHQTKWWKRKNKFKE